MSMATMEQPAAKNQDKSETPYKDKDYKSFIKKNLPEIDRTIIKINMTNITPSYWRVNVWGRKINSTCAFGDNEIIMSKFIRIDIDSKGQMVYNDVTNGKNL